MSQQQRWVPLHSHTYYSLLDGISKPARIAYRANQLGYPAIAMTDHGNIGAAVEFSSACQAQKIKPILGCEFYICKHDPSIRPTAENGKINGRPYDHLVVLAKNLNGWKKLVAATSFSNKKEHIYYQPRMSVESFRDFADGNLIAFSGHPGSELSTVIFSDPRAAFSAQSIEEVCKYFSPDRHKLLKTAVERYISVFGKENFFIEVQKIDPVAMPACAVVAKAMRWAAEEFGLLAIATADSHYVDQSDCLDQQVVICSAIGTTLRAVKSKTEQNEDVALGGFFKTNKFHIPSVKEMLVHHKPEELEAAARVADMCEEYSIKRPPMFPAFPCPDGLSPDTYLRELCERGWRDKIDGRIPDSQIGGYRDRLEMELGVFREAGLSSYFLIIQDIIAYGESQGWFMGGIRGSGAGCFVSHMCGISDIDPILYGLLFERFFNAGRKGSLPDIDVDVPKFKKEALFKYMGRKYGEDKVAKIATYNSMKGRGALTEVMRAWSVDLDLVKEITKIMPDPARISEELQDIRDTFTEEEKAAGREPSVIEYCLETFASDLAEWVRMRDDGTLEGDYAKQFEQAISLEGTKKNISQHAAGVIITPEPIADMFPLVYDSGSNSYIVGFDMHGAEATGGLKIDILAVAFCDKSQAVRDLALTGRIGGDD